MPVYDDYDGVYFTVQALKMYHDVDFELIVVDNNPSSPHGEETKNFVTKWSGGRYIPVTEKTGTSVKNEIFKASETEYTLCIDCHVLIQRGSLNSLTDYYKSNPDTTNLIQGPLLLDNLEREYTHFNDKWGSLMHGQWATDSEKLSKEEPFEISSMGMGLFSCRTDAWPGFHELFKGFGGEEGYIHRKFRNRGDKCLCLPDLKWIHRFGRPSGIPYPNILEDRLWNYIIGALDTLDPRDAYFDEIFSEFRPFLPQGTVESIFQKAKTAYFDK